MIEWSKVKRIHLIGVAGTGMGSFAGMLKAAGHEVTGSDENVYPPMSTQLARWGIEVMTPYRAENLDRARPDLVVVGNVVRAVNPEATAMRERGLPHVSFPAALGERFIGPRHGVVVVGTHGKTTTSAMMGALLHHAGPRPVVPRRRRDPRLRLELPARRGPPLRRRGRRVRHRLLRQGPQVPPLPAAHRDLHELRARPRRHLPGRGALRERLRGGSSTSSRRTGSSPRARATTASCGSPGARARRSRPTRWTGPARTGRRAGSPSAPTARGSRSCGAAAARGRPPPGGRRAQRRERARRRRGGHRARPLARGDRGRPRARSAA